MPCRAELSRAEPGRAEPSRPEPTRAEPSRVESSRAEPSRVESSRAEPSRAEPSRAEPSRAEPSRAEPCRAEPSRAEPSRTEPSRAEPSRAVPCRAEPCRAEPSRVESSVSSVGAGWFSLNPPATDAAIGSDRRRPTLLRSRAERRAAVGARPRTLPDTLKSPADYGHGTASPLSAPCCPLRETSQTRHERLRRATIADKEVARSCTARAPEA